MTAGPDDDTSTMVLWFSTNGGLVYYNEGAPQDTVFLYQDLPRGRKLEGCNVEDATFFGYEGVTSALVFANNGAD